MTSQLSNSDALLNVSMRLGGPALVSWHHENGTDISPIEYVDRYRRVRAAGMEGSQRIYLDTNYWVRLRQAQLGQIGGVWPELLRVVRSRVRDRSAICLLNYWSIVELCRQFEDSLRATSALVEEFCEGVCLAAPHEIMEMQVGEYLASKAGGAADYSLDRWTTFSRFAKTHPPIPEGTSTPVVKAIWDSLFAVSMSDFMEAVQWQPRDNYGMQHVDRETINALTKLKAKRLRENKSRQAIRVEEFHGVMLNHYHQHFTNHLHRTIHIGSDPSILHKEVSSLIEATVEAFRLDRLGTHLSHAAIASDLSALFFVDRKRKLNANDYMDWQHAATAVPYSHVFLTEDHLRSQLDTLKAGQRFGCRIISNESRALEYLRTQH